MPSSRRGWPRPTTPAPVRGPPPSSTSSSAMSPGIPSPSPRPRPSPCPPRGSGARARVWPGLGGGRRERVASAGSTSPMGFFVSSEQGVLAEIMRGVEPVRQCPVDAQEWEAALPSLPSLPTPGSALFVPLAAVGRPFGVMYALRSDPIAFTDSALRRAVRFVERVEPALAWAMQLRSVQRWAEASQDFLRITTHELRRPLTVLRGYLEMLDTVSPDDGAILRERIDRAAEQLAELLTDVTQTITLADP